MKRIRTRITEAYIKTRRASTSRRHYTKAATSTVLTPPSSSQEPTTSSDEQKQLTPEEDWDSSQETCTSYEPKSTQESQVDRGTQAPEPTGNDTFDDLNFEDLNLSDPDFTMANDLTVGALHSIFSDGAVAKELYPNPVLQVLQIKLLNAQTTVPERYRIVFSDSANFVQSIVATQCNQDITSGKVKRGGFVRVSDYATNYIKGKKVLMVLGFEVLEHLGESEKVGEPVALAAEDGSTEQKPVVKKEEPSSNANNFYGNQNRQQAGVAPQAARSNPKFAGNQRSSAVTINPIESLSPYQNKWTIKARCTHKTEIKTWRNQKGEGKLFAVNLLDQSGEIKATGFNDQCDLLYDVFQEGSVYLIGNCSVNIANKKFSNIDNEYELMFRRESQVEKAEDGDDDVPRPTFNFISLGDLDKTEKDSVVDVVGVVKEVGEVSEIMTQKSKPFSKRDVTLVDQTGYEVKLTLWGKTAQNFETAPESVIAFKGVKVSDFGGRSLSLQSSGSMSVDPDIDEAHRLKGWFEGEGRSTSFASHQGMATSMGAGASRDLVLKTIQQVKDENLGMSDQPDNFACKATIVYIKQQGASYPACASEGCNKKVVESPDGNGWVCDKCSTTHPQPQHRYIMSVSVNDATGQAWFSCFDDVGKLIMGITANELMEINDNDHERAGQVFTDANCKSFIFKVRAKMDSFNNEPRVRYQVTSALPINYAQEALKLADVIKSYSIN